MKGLDLESTLLIAIAFAVGGILKGATGAGAPIVAVPVLALIYNVQTAVALFIVPNIVTNLIQLFQYRRSDKRLKFSRTFAVLVYISFRLAHPQWQLDMS